MDLCARQPSNSEALRGVIATSERGDQTLIDQPCGLGVGDFGVSHGGLALGAALGDERRPQCGRRHHDPPL